MIITLVWQLEKRKVNLLVPRPLYAFPPTAHLPSKLTCPLCTLFTPLPPPHSPGRHLNAVDKCDRWDRRLPHLPFTNLSKEKLSEKLCHFWQEKLNGEINTHTPTPTHKAIAVQRLTIGKCSENSQRKLVSETIGETFSEQTNNLRAAVNNCNYFECHNGKMENGNCRRKLVKGKPISGWEKVS